MRTELLEIIKNLTSLASSENYCVGGTISEAIDTLIKKYPTLSLTERQELEAIRDAFSTLDGPDEQDTFDDKASKRGLFGKK